MSVSVSDCLSFSPNVSVISKYFRKHLEVDGKMFFFSPVSSYSGGSEELSDDITQQQLLPGVK